MKYHNLLDPLCFSTFDIEHSEATNAAIPTEDNCA